MLCDPVKTERRGGDRSRLRVARRLPPARGRNGRRARRHRSLSPSPRRRRAPAPSRAPLESRRRSARPTANRRPPPVQDRRRAPACAHRISHARARRRPNLARRRGRTPRRPPSSRRHSRPAIRPRMLCDSNTAYNSPVMYVANSTRRPRSTIAHLLCVPGSTARTRSSSCPIAPTSCVSSPRMTSGTPAAPMQRAPGTMASSPPGVADESRAERGRDPPGIRRRALRPSPAGCRSSRRRSAAPHRRANRRAACRARHRSGRRAAFRCRAARCASRRSRPPHRGDTRAPTWFPSRSRSRLCCGIRSRPATVADPAGGVKRGGITRSRRRSRRGGLSRPVPLACANAPPRRHRSHAPRPSARLRASLPFSRTARGS